MRSTNPPHRAFALAIAAATLPLLSSSATAQSVSSPAMTTSHIAAGVVHNRLVPMARTSTARTISWQTERRFVEYRGSRAVMQVMTIGASGHVQIDSLLFYRATLRPVWEHLHGGGTSTFLSFNGTHVTGRVTQRDSAARQIDVTTAIPPYSGTIDDVVVQSVPLVSGYHVVLPFVGGDGIVELDTIQVRKRERVPTRNSAREAWAVDLSYPSGSETLWIDPETRTIARHIYTSKDHSQREVVTS
jgi:hypothetical protein